MANTLSAQWFRAQWNRSKDRAGKRFTEELDVGLPLSRYFESVTFAEEFFGKFAKAADGIEETWRNRLQHSSSDDALEFLRSEVPAIVSDLHNLVLLHKTAAEALPFEHLAERISKASNVLAAPLSAALEKLRSATQEEKSAAEYRVESFSRMERQLVETRELLTSPETLTANKPLILLLGAAGAGKTHLLCEMTKERIDAGAPALLFLGQAFQSPFDDVLAQLASSVGWSSSPDEFFAELDKIARQQETRCLVGIDAINEGNRQSWVKAIPMLAGLVQRHPGIAIVISCRMPFEKILLPDAPALGFSVVTHYGYPPEIQSGAVETYFKGYSIPIPEVPFLEEEFGNPLFLKLFCEALEKVTIKAKHQQIRDIAAGQIGMTHILEYFVDAKDAAIAQELGTRSRLSWDFLKILAKLLATRHVMSIAREEVINIADSLQPPGLESGRFLQALINEDILAEDVIFDAQFQAVEVVRPTYQKFADHLVARYLLDSQLDPSSTESIKLSLQDPARLGFIFKDDESALENINIAQAIVIEFPTRVNNAGELFDYLDWEGLPVRLCEAFIEGLYWREPSSINERTVQWVSRCLESDRLSQATLNVLVALSVKPQHPLGLQRLEKFLRGMSLVDRDSFWSEYLRGWTNRGTPTRILIWAEHSAQKASSSTEFIATYISVVKWFLTSTQRAFRDRATHALFDLGLRHPQLLFPETIASLSVNDIYVSERMLAASYGVTMAFWAGPQGHFQQKVLPEYAREIFDHMFGEKASYSTTHILARDYALGTIELALKLDPNLLSGLESQLVTKPFKLGGIRDWKTAEDRDDEKYRDGDSPLGMDFENYTLGRLVPNRSPYDSKNPDYQRVRGQILWRIYELGYTLEKFSAVDREIARDSWRHDAADQGGKTDRYGKKYAWVAFYELAGFRQDLGKLPNDEPRISDADIDPSFPRNPSVPKYFTESWIPANGSVRDWMHGGFRPDVARKLISKEMNGLQGSWVMLHGFVDQSSPDKTIFTSFQGLFVAPGNLDRALAVLVGLEYPGNTAVSRPEEEHYTYAGEIPWRDTWRSQQYPASIGLQDNEVSVYLPVREYSWESYHSAENHAGGTKFLSKEIAQHLNMHVQIPQTTMATFNSDVVGTIFVRNGEAYHNHESLLFISQDLLDKYLTDKNLVFLLFAWGERRGNYARDGAREEEGHFRIEDTIHRQGFRYDAKGKFDRFL